MQAAVDMMEAVLHAAPPQTDIRAFLKMTQRNFLSYLEKHPFKVKVLFQSIDVTEDPEMKNEVRNVLQRLYDLFFAVMEDAQKRGEMRRNLPTGTEVIYILGFNLIVAAVEFLDLDWFKGDLDVFTVVDAFADEITARQRKHRPE
jgi:hypothetical protein